MRFPGCTAFSRVIQIDIYTKFLSFYVVSFTRIELVLHILLDNSRFVYKFSAFLHFNKPYSVCILSDSVLYECDFVSQATVASKFILLTESVRDAADLYLSLKNQPVVFINDTPCGFVRHLECRDAVTAHSLWGDKAGCFEKPIMGKRPDQVWFKNFYCFIFLSADCINYLEIKIFITSLL